MGWLSDGGAYDKGDSYQIGGIYVGVTEIVNCMTCNSVSQIWLADGHLWFRCVGIVSDLWLVMWRL